mmetsp:Transcript_5613/g.15755  ORF Transcript_5613/g.15755 Transcript_5613/m.15755 type:complete len:305 (-) Transcript_5613:991-1905(-)
MRRQEGRGLRARACEVLHHHRAVFRLLLHLRVPRTGDDGAQRPLRLAQGGLLGPGSDRRRLVFAAPAADTLPHELLHHGAENCQAPEAADGQPEAPQARRALGDVLAAHLQPREHGRLPRHPPLLARGLHRGGLGGRRDARHQDPQAHPDLQGLQAREVQRGLHALFEGRGPVLAGIEPDACFRRHGLLLVRRADLVRGAGHLVSRRPPRAREARHRRTGCLLAGGRAIDGRHGHLVRVALHLHRPLLLVRDCDHHDGGLRRHGPADGVGQGPGLAHHLERRGAARHADRRRRGQLQHGVLPCP